MLKMLTKYFGGLDFIFSRILDDLLTEVYYVFLRYLRARTEIHLTIYEAPSFLIPSS